MSMVNTKFATRTVQIAINLAVLGAVLSQIAFPLTVKADIPTEMAKFSYGNVFPGQIVTQGPAPIKPVKISIRPINREIPDKVIEKAVISAYTSTQDQTDDSPFIAANGKRVHDGMIAANGLPFGTRIKIPSVYGEKIFVVEDRMNRRYGYGHFDVWLDTTKAEAMKFGVKRVKVEIFYPEKMVAKK